MRLFLGEFTQAVDDRGRVTLSRKIRSELADRGVILTRGFDPCIFGYEREAWETEAAKQLTASVTERSGRDVRRYMFSGAEKVEIDKLGRILLPAHLKEYAGLKGEVMIIGAGDHFEIWDTKAWKAYAQNESRV